MGMPKVRDFSFLSTGKIMPAGTTRLLLLGGTQKNRNREGRWPKDKGMRLDHFLLSPKVSDRLVEGGVDRWAHGEVNASDHAPTRIMLDL
jgi:endonuclease/exonuclease/phosphatase family metal-dependent hydrolase